MYCGLSTASEVFLIFTAQLYSCLCNYNAMISYLAKREVLQQEYSPPPILPSPHFRWVVNLYRTSYHVSVRLLHARYANTPSNVSVHWVHGEPCFSQTETPNTHTFPYCRPPAKQRGCLHYGEARRVSSVVDHSSANPKGPSFDSGPGLIPGSWIMMRHV